MVLTPGNQPAIDDRELLEEQVQSIPSKRAAESVEIARLAVLLASSAGDDVTGATYMIDGGVIAQPGSRVVKLTRPAHRVSRSSHPRKTVRSG